MWKISRREDVLSLISEARRSLLACSPYITRYGIRLIEAGLSNRRLQEIEIWTKFDMRDWLTGASDVDALRDFARDLPKTTRLTFRISERLHAKFIVVDDARAIAGSANLTAGGLMTNIEIIRLLPQDEVPQLLTYVNDTRQLLEAASLQDLDFFVSQCNREAGNREALLDLIRETMPPPPGGRRPLIPLAEFVRFSQQFATKPARDVTVIFLNQDGNNRIGHLMQGFYAVQRFLQEYPQHIPYVSQLPVDEAFPLVDSPVYRDWLAFLGRFRGESEPAYKYDLATLVESYLNQPLGGTRRRGGGAGDYPFKIVWPFVGRLMSQT